MASKKDEDVEMEGGATQEEPAEAAGAGKPSEREEDASSSDTRPKLDVNDIVFKPQDMTLNVQPALEGKLLMSLSDGGFQYLLAGARANIGLKAGRYMFEVTIVESRNPSEGSSSGNVQTPRPRQLARLGFATDASSLFLGDGAESVCFDSEGIFSGGGETKKLRVGKKFGQGDVMAVVLNLDSSSPNANTVSLFKDGVRASEPQPLPEAMKGKPLFPAVTFRNMTIRPHFGPAPLQPLPFRCRCVGDAAKADAVISKLETKEQKYEVLFPVGLPDEGTYDWLDQFLAENRNYSEISDRAIIQWATKSGIRPSEKKGVSFGIPLLDDFSVQRILHAVIPTMQRNFVVVDIKGNLLADERTAAAARFSDCEFKKVAHVLMGEPDAEFKSYVQGLVLKEKQDKGDRKKKLEAERKKAEELRKKKALEAKKAREARAGKKNGEEAKEGEDNDVEKEEKDEKEEKEDEKNEEEKKEDEPAEAGEEPKVDLTEDEKKLWYRKSAVGELSSKELSAVFSQFSIPTKTEGFSEIKFVWQSEKKAQEYLSQWISQRKLTQRVESLQPGEWFKQQKSEWDKLVSDWKRKQQDFKDGSKKRVAEQKKKDAAKKKKEEEKKKNAEKAEVDTEGAEEGAKEDGMEEEKDEVKIEINADDLDVFSVEDVSDIGNGEPLYANFDYADWLLLGLRYELHLLVHAFRRDLDDPERISFHESQAGFYYSRYFKKQLTAKEFGVADLGELVDLVKDTMDISKENSTVDSSLSDDTPLDNFIKLAEEDRRDRMRRLDMGDTTAELKVKAPEKAPPAQGSSPRDGSHGPPTSRASYAGGATSGGGTARPAASGRFGAPSPAPSAYGQKRPLPAASPYGGKPSSMPRTSYGMGMPPPAYGGYGPPPTAAYGKGAYGYGPPPAYGASPYDKGYGKGYGW